jgi:hypothetical protein
LEARIATCAAAILAGDLHPGAQIVSLVTGDIRDFVIRSLASQADQCAAARRA